MCSKPLVVFANDCCEDFTRIDFIDEVVDLSKRVRYGAIYSKAFSYRSCHTFSDQVMLASIAQSIYGFEVIKNSIAGRKTLLRA